MKCEFGYCTTCEKEIALPREGSQTRIPTNDYSEVEVKWTNGSRMKIAVCVNCAKSHIWATPEAKKGITIAHWEAWDKLGGAYDQRVVIE